MKEEIRRQIPTEILYGIYLDVLGKADRLFIAFASKAMADNWTYTAIIKAFEELLETIYNRMEELLNEELDEGGA